MEISNLWEAFGIFLEYFYSEHINFKTSEDFNENFQILVAWSSNFSKFDSRKTRIPNCYFAYACRHSQHLKILLWQFLFTLPTIPPAKLHISIENSFGRNLKTFFLKRRKATRKTFPSRRQTSPPILVHENKRTRERRKIGWKRFHFNDVNSQI